MTPKEECEILLDKFLPAVESLLKKNGEFYPVGAVMNTNGEIVFTAIGDEEYPSPDSLISGLTIMHKKQADNDEIKVSGIAWNAVIQDENGSKKDAIIVSLEHKDDYSVIIGEPYKIGLFKKISFLPIFAQQGKHDIWKR